MEVIVNQQISNESFSHGWLGNMKQSWDFLEESLSRSFDGGSFIEVDPDFFSMRWTDSRGFDFNLPACDEASPAVNADQIFFNGHLLPLHLMNPSKGGAGSSSATPSSDSALWESSSLSRSKSWHDSASANSSPSLRSPDSMSPRSCGNKQSTKSPVKILRKYLCFLVPLYRKMKVLKMTSSKPRSSADPSRSSPRMSNASPNLERRRGRRAFDAEAASSIHDAVLHCKKSIAPALGVSDEVLGTKLL